MLEELINHYGEGFMALLTSIIAIGTLVMPALQSGGIVYNFIEAFFTGLTG